MSNQQSTKKSIAPMNMQMMSPDKMRQQMEYEQEMRSILTQFISSNMKKGTDYGSINMNGRESKETLFKPGAEKFCSLFKLRPEFVKDDATLEMLGNQPGTIAYKCELIDSKGKVVGEGRGVATVDTNGKEFDINKSVKMAEKRAQIDAVLRTGGLSDFFTQDLEDLPKLEPEKTMTPTQLDRLKQILIDKGVEDEEDRRTIVKHMTNGQPLNTSAARRIADELEKTNPDTLQEVLKGNF